MPLPPDCTLSLLGYSRPGDTVQSKPKQAIIIRLSTEILDALESSSDAIKVDFSDSPIFWAGSTHFSMNALKENLHHELYLRAASAGKKNAPLKLHASVVGKFQVERQLDNDVRSRLRLSAKTLQEQRQERGIIQLETPPTYPASKALKKAGTVKVKASRLTNDHVKNNDVKGSIRDAASGRVRKESPSSVRRRIVQLLAVSDRTADEIAQLFGEHDRTPSDRLGELLEQVAEAYPNEADASYKSPKRYRLKLKAWPEVRPAEWNWSNEHERSIVSAKFENALRRLGIPETDPVWLFSHQNRRAASSTSSAATAKHLGPPGRAVGGASKVDSLPQRALVSTKDKRTKLTLTRADSASEEAFKDEHPHTGKIAAVQRKVKGHEAISLLPAPKASAPLRKPPGSGFRSVKPSLQVAAPTAMEDPDHSHRDFITRSRDSTPLLQGRPVVANQTRENNGTMQKTNKLDPDSSRLCSVIKESRETLGKGDDDSCLAEFEGTMQKRKITARGPVDGVSQPISKKRKCNPVDSPRSSSHEAGLRGQTSKSLKKVEFSGLHKSKGESASTSRRKEKAKSPGSSLSLDNVPSSQNSSSKSSTANKRRRSPIYTSSDDDAEPKHANKGIISRPALPTDHASLRRRYKKSYGEYLMAFHKLVTLRDKIDGILRNHDGNNAGFVSDSDADLELIDPDELGRLCGRHKRLRDELESIQQVFSQSA